MRNECLNLNWFETVAEAKRLAEAYFDALGELAQRCIERGLASEERRALL